MIRFVPQHLARFSPWIKASALAESSFQLNMKIFIALCLVAVAFASEDALAEVLKSPKATLQLYSDYKAKEHIQYLNAEDRMRFRIFRKNAEFVAAANSVEDTAVFGLNFFSSMTEGEKNQYLGLNATGHLPNSDVMAVSAGYQGPAEKLWVNEGAVTMVKNQGSCGSCWTFGAVGGLETRYQQQSGKLRKFSEQEYLDCVYEGRKDGCKGGWPSDSYTYSKKNGGRLAADADYPYRGRDGSCQGGSKPDAMIASKISGYSDVRSGEFANIQALASGALSVAFEVTNYFQQYRGGIIRDNTCRGRPNHAVTSVGYTAKYVLVKNSWGATWGDNGFVKFGRGHGGCGLFDYSSFPTLSSTGKSDRNPSDPATKYTPSDDDGPAPRPDPQCVDKATNCTKDYCR